MILHIHIVAIYGFLVTAPTPHTSVTTSHAGPFYAGTGLSLMCNISTHPAVDTPIIERVQWVVDGRRLYNPVSTDRRTFSEQTNNILSTGYVRRHLVSL